jgi:ArsR family transcriptional regulator, arsenate/arsenite/antimonite-responsive transcriptional repressor
MSIKRCCPPTKVVTKDFSEAAVLLKALSDRHRLTIIATLAASPNEVCVCDFTDGLPLNQPTVSHHLRTLRDAGLVTWVRRGTWVYYRLAPSAADRVREVLDTAFRKKAKAA